MAHARGVRSQAHHAIGPRRARLERTVEVRRVGAVEHEVRGVAVRASVDLLDRSVQRLAAR